MANDKETLYRYSGPLSGVTLRIPGEAGAVQEVNKPLNPGAEVSLPADHPYVRKLVLKKLLTEITAGDSDPADTAKPRRSVKSAGTTEEATTNAG